MNWEDGKLFLAIARAGQMYGAARVLGVNQATLSRRMTRLETRLGSRLFVRKPQGCELTDHGRVLMASLERVEGEMLKVQSTLQMTDASVSGAVRIGAPDGFGVSFLASHLGRLADQHPGLSIQLVPVPRSFSLSQREADIAIMIGRPKHGRLVVRKLTDYTLGLYASRSYIKNYPAIDTVSQLSQHRLIGYVDDLIYAPLLNYTAEFWRNWKTDIAISSATGQLEAVQAGAGIGILHDYLAFKCDDLINILPHMSARRAYWSAYHESLRGIARIQVVSDFLHQITRENHIMFSRAFQDR